MKAGRKKSKRQRASRSRDVEAAVEQQMQLLLSTMRRGFGIDQPNFEDARGSLRRQVILRGGDGRLRDVVCFLSEDGKSAMLAAEWGSDRPVCANFVLPTKTTESEFDPEFYVRQCEK